MIHLTDTSHEIVNFFLEHDPEGLKGLSLNFIYNSNKDIQTPRSIRFSIKELVRKNIIRESNFIFHLNPTMLQQEIKVHETTIDRPATKFTAERIRFVLKQYQKKYSDYPLPRQAHELFQEVYNTKVNPQSFCRTMRKLGEAGNLERIPIGNKFKYKPKRSDWSDKPLNKFIG